MGGDRDQHLQQPLLDMLLKEVAYGLTTYLTHRSILVQVEEINEGAYEIVEVRDQQLLQVFDSVSDEQEDSFK